MALNANVPPKERRGLVLIDPPYEEADDFTRFPARSATAHRKWPTGIYLLWYPIKERDAPDALARRLRRLAVPKMLRCEMTLGAPRADSGPRRLGSDRGQPAVHAGAGLGDFAARTCPGPFAERAQRLDWLVGEQSASAADR